MNGLLVGWLIWSACHVKRQTLEDSLTNVTVQCTFRTLEERWNGFVFLKARLFLKMERGRIGTSISLEPGSKGCLNIYGKTHCLFCFCPVLTLVGWFYVVYMQSLSQIGAFQNKSSSAEKETRYHTGYWNAINRFIKRKLYRNKKRI